MVQIYNEKDYQIVKSQKKNFLKCFIITLAVVLVICIAAFVFFTLQEFNTPYRLPLLIGTIVFSGTYAIIYYILFAVKYKRIKSYYNMLYHIENGIRNENANAFVRIDSSIVTKDGVDFVSLVFLDWSEKKQDYFERYVLYDLEKPLPDFKKGDFIKYVTQGNKMIAYELHSQEIFE